MKERNDLDAGGGADEVKHRQLKRKSAAETDSAGMVRDGAISNGKQAEKDKGKAPKAGAAAPPADGKSSRARPRTAASASGASTGKKLPDDNGKAETPVKATKLKASNPSAAKLTAGRKSGTRLVGTLRSSLTRRLAMINTAMDAWLLRWITWSAVGQSSQFGTSGLP